MPQNLIKAVEYYRMGMKRDNTYAMYKIASFHESGEHAEKNPQLAFNLYKKAAFLGDKDAQAVVDEYRLAAKNGNREAIILINNSD